MTRMRGEESGETADAAVGRPAARFFFVLVSALALLVSGWLVARQFKAAEPRDPVVAALEERSGARLSGQAAEAIASALSDHERNLRYLHGTLVARSVEALSVPSEIAATLFLPGMIEDPAFAKRLSEQYAEKMRRLPGREAEAAIGELDSMRVAALSAMALQRIERLSAASGLSGEDVVVVMISLGRMRPISSAR